MDKSKGTPNTQGASIHRSWVLGRSRYRRIVNELVVTGSLKQLFEGSSSQTDSFDFE